MRGSKCALASLRTSVIALGSLLAVGTSPTTAVSALGPEQGAFLLERNRAGPVEIGEPIDDLYREIGRENVRLRDEFREGLFTPILEISVLHSDSTAALVADIRELPCPMFSVWDISVRDKRFRTSGGIGIGSTLGEVRRAYRTLPISGEGAQGVVADEVHMTFGIEGSLSDETSRVDGITLPSDPEWVRQKRCPRK
jgi:hypothetical protein